MHRSTLIYIYIYIGRLLGYSCGSPCPSLYFSCVLNVIYSVQRTSCMWVQPALHPSIWQQHFRCTVKGITGASRKECGGVFVFGMKPVDVTSSCTTISSTLVSWRGSRGGLFKLKIPWRPWQSSVSTCVSILQIMKKTVIAKLCPGVNDFLTQQDFI